MAIKTIKPTNALDVLVKLLTGIYATDEIRPTTSNYTAKGCEAILEYHGTFYRISVEAMALKDE